MYGSTVYPTSQTGATGIALEAGVVGRNLTESQYGIASIKFRWNLSGTYQQVLPDMYQPIGTETTSGNSYGIILRFPGSCWMQFSKGLSMAI